MNNEEREWDETPDVTVTYRVLVEAVDGPSAGQEVYRNIQVTNNVFEEEVLGKTVASMLETLTTNED